MTFDLPLPLSNLDTLTLEALLKAVKGELAEREDRGQLVRKDKEVQRLVKSTRPGHRADAVKLVRQMTNCNLEEAIRIVDEMSSRTSSSLFPKVEAKGE
jgi:flagellar motility protein MotE (MotC chaperone)